ncbi:MAG TPA: ketosteroid isomerase [Chromatiales bacterium]|nr:ketosteroid isomerase [Chromatiales bacterium]
MNNNHPTPQDAEDAFYDALEENDLERLMSVWEDSDDIACLLPMQPLQQGREPVRHAWKPLLKADTPIEVQIKHLHWIQNDTLAMHLVEEQISVQGQPQKQPPVYAVNAYRKGPDGWRMVLHQNSPFPPPPGMMPPMAPPA